MYMYTSISACACAHLHCERVRLPDAGDVDCAMADLPPAGTPLSQSQAADDHEPRAASPGSNCKAKKRLGTFRRPLKGQQRAVGGRGSGSARQQAWPPQQR